jgi:hypothetical protein
MDLSSKSIFPSPILIKFLRGLKIQIPNLLGIHRPYFQTKKKKKKQELHEDHIYLPSQSVDEQCIVSIGESEWRLVVTGEVTASNYAVSVGHSNKVL